MRKGGTRWSGREGAWGFFVFVVFYSWLAWRSFCVERERERERQPMAGRERDAGPFVCVALCVCVSVLYFCFRRGEAGVVVADPVSLVSVFISSFSFVHAQQSSKSLFELVNSSEKQRLDRVTAELISKEPPADPSAAKTAAPFVKRSIRSKVMEHIEQEKERETEAQ